jgi:hypothetical protein
MKTRRKRRRGGMEKRKREPVTPKREPKRPRPNPPQQQPQGELDIDDDEYEEYVAHMEWIAANVSADDPIQEGGKRRKKKTRKKRGGWVGEVCPICQEKMKRSGPTHIVQTTGCVGDDDVNRPHTFHLNCINKWLNMGNNTCPMCRHVINSDLITVYPRTCSDKCKQKVGKLWENVKEKIKNIREARQQTQVHPTIPEAARVDFNAINRESRVRQENIIMSMINRPPQRFDAARDEQDIRENLFRPYSGGKRKKRRRKSRKNPKTRKRRTKKKTRRRKTRRRRKN